MPELCWTLNKTQTLLSRHGQSNRKQEGVPLWHQPQLPSDCFWKVGVCRPDGVSGRSQTLTSVPSSNQVTTNPKAKAAITGSWPGLVWTAPPCQEETHPHWYPRWNLGTGYQGSAMHTLVFTSGHSRSHRQTRTGSKVQNKLYDHHIRGPSRRMAERQTGLKGISFFKKTKPQEGFIQGLGGWPLSLCETS